MSGITGTRRPLRRAARSVALGSLLLGLCGCEVAVDRTPQAGPDGGGAGQDAGPLSDAGLFDSGPAGHVHIEGANSQGAVTLDWDFTTGSAPGV
jgi:hypothetical protein